MKLRLMWKRSKASQIAVVEPRWSTQCHSIHLGTALVKDCVRADGAVAPDHRTCSWCGSSWQMRLHPQASLTYTVTCLVCFLKIGRALTGDNDLILPNNGSTQSQRQKKPPKSNKRNHLIWNESPAKNIITRGAHPPLSEGSWPR
jgi:hypothetical protein